MSDWKLKRFWTEAAASETDNGWTVTLDGRAVKTPAKALLTVPTQALAEAVAAEWAAQEGEVNPNAMPFTRLANSAQDKVAVQHADVAAMLAEYGGSDLLCYRAQSPQELVDRQAAEWDPLLAWIAEAEGIVLNVQSGIMPTSQPEDALDRIHTLTRAMTPTVLTGFHDLVALSGSWVIAYRALSDAAQAEALWQAAHVDEIWQAEQWGDDEEALATRAIKRAAFIDALTFARFAL